MKLTLKKAFRPVNFLGDKFSVKDENNNERFTAKGVSVKIGVYDTTGALVATLKRGAGMLQGKHYSIEIGGNEVCEISRKTKVVGMDVEITGLPWVLEYGNATFQHKLMCNDEVIMAITDKVAFLGESYDIEIFDAENELTCVAIALAIDYIKK